MAGVYYATGQPSKALALYEEALPIRREVGDRAGEATTLNGLAYLLMNMENLEQALDTFEQSVRLEQTVLHRAGEAAGLVGMAILLYRHLDRGVDAQACVQAALDVLRQTGLGHDAAGRTVEQLQQMLAAMQGEPQPPSNSAQTAIPAEQLDFIADNTVTVLTGAPEHLGAWRQAVAGALAGTEQAGAEAESAFFVAILALLDGRPASLPADSPYADVWERIRRGMGRG